MFKKYEKETRYNNSISFKCPDCNAPVKKEPPCLCDYCGTRIEKVRKEKELDDKAKTKGKNNLIKNYRTYISISIVAIIILVIISLIVSRLYLDSGTLRILVIIIFIFSLEGSDIASTMMTFNNYMEELEKSNPGIIIGALSLIPIAIIIFIAVNLYLDKYDKPDKGPPLRIYRVYHPSELLEPPREFKREPTPEKEVKKHPSFCARCGRILSDKSSALCDSCKRRVSPKCLSCGRTLWNANEKTTGICNSCRRSSRTVCVYCGGTLWNSNERNMGICSFCQKRRF
ncbi:MAG: hypothetical protein ACFFDN_21365 [Candidatus Hodarchaeota archaeon]